MKKLFFMSLLGLGVFSNQATYTKDLYTMHQKDLSYYNKYDLTILGHALLQQAKDECIRFAQTVRNITNALLITQDVEHLKQFGMNIDDLETFKKSFKKIQLVPQQAQLLISSLSKTLDKKTNLTADELKTILKKFCMDFKKLHDLLYT